MISIQSNEIGMAINVYRLQPCLRGSWRARIRRLVFFCSLCHLIWVPLAAIFAAFASPPLRPNLSQAPTPLFNDTATSLVNTDDDEFSIEHVTWNEHFNYTGLIIAVQGDYEALRKLITANFKSTIDPNIITI